MSASASWVGKSSSCLRRMTSPMVAPSRSASERSWAPVSKPRASVASGDTCAAPGTFTRFASVMLGARRRYSRSAWSRPPSTSNTV